MTCPRLHVLLAALSGLVLLAAAPVQAEPVYLTGSRIGIEPPAGMTRSDTAPRFEDAAREAAITVLELPVQAYEEIEKGMFAPSKDPSVTIVERETFAFGGGFGYLVQVHIATDGNVRRKWILLGRHFGGAPLTALVTADIPDSAQKTYSEAVIRAALASVTFRAAPVNEQLALMPFKLDDLAGFRVVRAVPSVGVQLTEGPLDQSPQQPSIVISIMPPGPSEPADRANIARQLLANFGLPELRITDTQTIRLNGVTTFEVKAEARDGAAGAPLSVVQWLRFGDGGFLRMVAIAPTPQWVDAYPRFRAVRDGIAPR